MSFGGGRDRKCRLRQVETSHEPLFPSTSDHKLHVRFAKIDTVKL